MSEKAEILKELLRSKPPILLLILGIVLVIFSFIEIEDRVVRSHYPNAIMLLIGFLFLIAGIVLYYYFEHPVPKGSRIIKKIDKEFKARVDASILNVIFGRIQDITNDDPHMAVVLPVYDKIDTGFLHDRESSGGAYVYKNFPGRHEDLIKLIREKERPTVTIEDTDAYPVGKSIYIENPFKTDKKMIFTVTTTKRKGAGIRADPSYIAKCVREIFMTATENKLTRIIMPVIGAGYGRLGIPEALPLLLYPTFYYLRYKVFHIKSLTIVIYDPKNEYRKDVERILNMVVGTIFFKRGG